MTPRTKCNAMLAAALLLAALHAPAKAQDSGPSGIEQIGGSTQAILQTGQSNTASVQQSVVASGAYPGNIGHADIQQNGNGNHAVVNQQGSTLSAAIDQRGNGNSGGIDQSGSNLAARIEQHGNGLGAQINQTGAGDGVPIVVRQY